ncbi:Pao retrotransposon peptidase family protein-like protein [Aphelenchoides avenae]|nr:Pao retrotransposon peptidase family protein-like protein [Aphelenchus avenae]
MEADGTIGRFDGTTRNSALFHFLAHHAVIKESSATTKIRHVFDGSAKIAGKPSINDQLHRGPVLLPAMAAILVRVRLHQILLIADIAKAFHQVSLHPADRSACAFLWLKDPLQPPSDDNLIYYRFHRVPFGLKPSPFLLGATIQMHLEKIGTPLAKEIWSNCYVDNVILGANSLDEALEKHHDSKACFASAKMLLSQFESNCSQFNKQLTRDDAAELDNLTNLDYQWDIESDCFRISLAPKPAKGPTKRRKNKGTAGELSQRLMTQRIARVFDPVGYLQPVLLPAKLVVQEMWKLETGRPAPPQLAEAWDAVIQHFEETIIVLPRRISAVPYDWMELHVYVDASKEAYGFATYLRTPADNNYNISLVYSRAKVKPLEEAERMSIPRMELMAFVLGARNAHFMADTLELQAVRRTIIWSDSMIVLQQLRTPDKSKEVFVENRLKEIRELQAELRFETRYVSTSENPADLVSRGLPAHELQSCDLRWHASPFLQLAEALWPPQPSVLNTVTQPSPFPPPMGSFCGVLQETSDAELEASAWEGTPSQDEAVSLIGGPTFHGRLLAWRDSLQERGLAALATLSEHEVAAAWPARFTSPGFVSYFKAFVRRTTWLKVQRIYCYVLRAVAAFFRLRNLADTTRTPLGIDFSQQFISTCPHADSVGTPTVHAYCGARLYTVRDLQIAATAAIWQTHQVHWPSKKEQHELNIVEHDGLLYVRGRLDKSTLASTTVTPLYIPRQSPLLPLVCYEYHRANLHAGISTTLANCRKLKNPPYTVPPWPVLPSARVNPSRPFSKVGVDYFGPVLLKSNPADGTPSAVIGKYYVCLFTCLCVRAVHCELVPNLTTEQFFHAFKRFTARRSYPDEVLSDNGTNFLAARQMISTIIRRKRGQQPDANEQPLHAHSVEPISSPNNITWHTITDHAPWRGGTYERMIGLIKDCLTKTLGRSRPTVDHYQTLLAQAEYIVNTRPLTYIHNSEREFTLVRPIDFLIPTRHGHQLNSYLEPSIDSQPRDDPDYAPATASDKVKRRHLWRDGYLIEKRRYFGKRAAGQLALPKVGDIVLVYTDNLPRTHWRLALVLELRPDEDFVARTAWIRLSGTGRETLRAVNHLYPLKPLLSDVDEDDTHAAEPVDQHLAVAAPPAGPSTSADSTGINIIQDQESGTPLIFSSTIAPPNTEDRTSTEPTSRATAPSSRGRRGSSRRHGPATRRR